MTTSKEGLARLGACDRKEAFSDNESLFEQYHSKGSHRARSLLIENNLGLVNTIAKKYFSTGCEFEDLRQEGVKGLIRAVDLFDPSKGAQFSTYAYRWIASFIENEVSRTGATVKIPERTRKLIRKLKNRERALLSEGICEADIPRALAQETGIESSKIEKMMSMKGYDVYLDAPARQGDRSEILKDRLENEDDFESKILIEDEVGRLKKVIDDLPEQRRLAIQHYHGLMAGGEECDSFKEVASLMGVSRQRANILYKEGIEMVRDVLSRE